MLKLPLFPNPIDITVILQKKLTLKIKSKTVKALNSIEKRLSRENCDSPNLKKSGG